MRAFAAILAASFCCPLLAAPPALPDHIRCYLDAATTGYELPHGQFEPYLQSHFEEEGQAEPWAIDGDINGDSIADWAGLLRNGDGLLDLVVVYSVEDEFSHEILANLGADEDGNYVGVVLEPVGTIHGFPFDDSDPDPTVTLQYPGIHLFYYEKSSVLYYWDTGTFRELGTSD